MAASSTIAMPIRSGLERASIILLRSALVVIFLWFGVAKFASYEAAGLAPLASASPLLSWAFAALGQQGFARALGVIEISIGILIALRPWSAAMSALGSIGACITFLVTLTLLLSTPGVVEPGYAFPFLSAMPGQFLLKDLVLLAASCVIAAEALTARAASGDQVRVR